MRPTLARRSLLAALPLSVAAIHTTRAAEPFRVRLDWALWGAHAPFYLALARGWFTRNGLDVSIEDGTGSVSCVQIVGNGQYDAGHASLAPLAIARGKGIPVKAIAAFARQNDIGAVLPIEAKIDSIQGLRGRKLLFTPGSLETPFIDSFLAAGGLKREDVDLVSVEASAKLGSYVAGRADGVFTSIPNILPMAAKLRPSMAIRFADHGLTMPSFGLLASERMISDNPDALRRFASVVAGAWTAIVAGQQDEAVAGIQKARPEMRMSAQVLRGEIDLLAEFFHTPATAGLPLGVMADADWDAASQNLAKAQLIPAAAPGSSYYTNSMLDPGLIAQTASGTA